MPDPVEFLARSIAVEAHAGQVDKAGEPTPMRALTVQQPWAWLIAAGIKPVENRAQPFSTREPVAIHAGATWSPAATRDRRVIAEFDRWRPAYRRGEPVDATELSGLSVFRAFVAVVTLGTGHSSRGCCAPWGDQTCCYHHPISDVQRLEDPIPWKRGQLGLWRVRDADTMRALHEAREELGGEPDA